mgnify:CR=1 FL=1
MLEVKNFSKTYSNGKIAVDNISFDLNSGEIFGFLGPNGAGKSSTIKSIVGINKATSGTIKINGISLDEDSLAYKSQFSYIPDNPELFDNYTGYEYINFLSDIYGIDEKTRKDRLDYYLQYFDIKEAMGDQIETYSHGMGQRLALIGGLINDPEILILDEPIVGLDAKSSYNLKQILRNRADEGKSVFFSTHLMSLAQELCDRIAIINKGKIIAMGTFDEIKTQASHKENLEAVFLELTDE